MLEVIAPAPALTPVRVGPAMDEAPMLAYGLSTPVAGEPGDDPATITVYDVGNETVPPPPRT